MMKKKPVIFPFQNSKSRLLFIKIKIVYLDVRSGSSPGAKFDAFERKKYFPLVKKEPEVWKFGKLTLKIWKSATKKSQEEKKYRNCPFLAPIRVLFGQVFILNWRKKEDFGIKSKPKTRKIRKTRKIWKIHTGPKHRNIEHELTQKIFKIDSGFERKEKMENVNV